MRRGRSFEKRVVEIQRIYDHYSKIGVGNREIWKRYVYPRFGVCERTFNNLIKKQVKEDDPSLLALLRHKPEEGLPLWGQS